MSDRTANLNLELPLGSKYWNYDTHNANMEKLDIASLKIDRGVIPDFNASGIICSDGITTVQQAIDELAHKNRKNLYSFTLDRNLEVSVGNYINAHCQVIVPKNTSYSLKFIKANPSADNEFKVQGGRYYGAGETIIDNWGYNSTAIYDPVTNSNVADFKLGDEYYYRVSQKRELEGYNFYIYEARDPFFNNIVESHEYMVTRAQTVYNYKDVFSVTTHYALVYGLSMSAIVNGVNYGWSPLPIQQVNYDRIFNFNFQHLNCLWTSQRLY